MLPASYYETMSHCLAYVSRDGTRPDLLQGSRLGDNPRGRTEVPPAQHVLDTGGAHLAVGPAVTCSYVAVRPCLPWRRRRVVVSLRTANPPVHRAKSLCSRLRWTIDEEWQPSRSIGHAPLASLGRPWFMVGPRVRTTRRPPSVDL